MFLLDDIFFELVFADERRAAELCLDVHNPFLLLVSGRVAEDEVHVF